MVFTFYAGVARTRLGSSSFTALALNEPFSSSSFSSASEFPSPSPLRQPACDTSWLPGKMRHAILGKRRHRWDRVPVAVRCRAPSLIALVISLVIMGCTCYITSLICILPFPRHPLPLPLAPPPPVPFASPVSPPSSLHASLLTSRDVDAALASRLTGIYSLIPASPPALMQGVVRS